MGTTQRAAHPGRSLAAAALGAALARAGVERLGSSARFETRRINYRGRAVSLAAGPALAAAASLSAAAGAAVQGRGRLASAALVAGLGAGAAGYFDDVVGARPGQDAKGFRGHLGALRRGRITGGVAKMAGVGAAALAAAALLPPRQRPRRIEPSRAPQGVTPRRIEWAGRTAEVILGAGVIAATANLVNLLDLRPGRALKAGLIAGGPLCTGPAAAAVAGPIGAAAALLPADLAERVMLGDCGANALGALLGAAAAARTGLIGRTALLAGLGALTAASERISFSNVIDSTAGLRWVDRLGRGGTPPPRSPQVHGTRPIAHTPTGRVPCTCGDLGPAMKR